MQWAWLTTVGHFGAQPAAGASYVAYVYLVMVICIVVGCSKRLDRDKDVSFYRIPAIRKDRGSEELELSRRRREGFLAAISRDDLTDSKIENGRICSRHFISGKPAELYDSLNPDWLPTLHLGHTKIKPSASADDRYQRTLRKRQRVASDITDDDLEAPQDHDKKTDVSCQTEKCEDTISQLRTELQLSQEKIASLESALSLYLPQSIPFGKDAMEAASETVILHYTGLPNFKLLYTVFEFVDSQASLPASRSKLTHFQEYMLVLMKLRRNLSGQDLAYRFNVHVSTVSRVFSKWLSLMAVKLKPLILWPEREDLRRTTPMCFRESFGQSVAVIIDCFEVFIERPGNLLARACTWSSYKHHNTIKVLIGTTPQGVISYVSQAWGGRTSDKYLTEHCGLLSNLLPGDVILADRGFDIAESVGMHQAKLHIPAFTKGKTQLSALEVEQTRTIVNVRIHVERVIGCVRQKYTILQSTLPIDYVTQRVGKEGIVIDEILIVCCALCNICDSVVTFN